MAILTLRSTAAASASNLAASAAEISTHGLRKLRQMGSSGGYTSGVVTPAAAASVVTTFLVLALMLNSMPARSQAYLPATMIDAMESSMFLNKFMDAADVTGYYDRFLDEKFSGTVFAPVDLGFDALLQKTNATWDELTSPELNETLSAIVGLHVIPGQRVFPLSSVREGTELTTAGGGKLYVRRDVPGVTHIYAVPRPEDDPLNFATVLQYQEIRGGKAILYVVDKVLLPPAKTSTAAPTPIPTRRRGAVRGGAALTPVVAPAAASSSSTSVQRKSRL